jgi:hypothetical protein
MVVKHFFKLQQIEYEDKIAQMLSSFKYVHANQCSFPQGEKS